MTGTGLGHRGLQMEEPTLFEQDNSGQCGVDLPEPRIGDDRLSGLERSRAIGLPGLSEPEIVRHYTRLSQKNFGIDSGFYPLGSCTMKHNSRLNEVLARLPGFADLHPLQPISTVQGALELMDELATWLKKLTGMPALAMSLAAGAHGELCGMMTIRAALEARGDARKRVLVPDSAHGTNPATAAICGYEVQTISQNERGRVDLGALRAALDDGVAAFMLTNPNTCGLFEDEIIAQAEAVHEAGAYFYCDGANFNAIVVAGAMGRPELLAAGISQALLTTAAGLTVAIPALIAYLFFISRVDRLIIDIDALGQQIVESISAEALREKQETSGKSKRQTRAA